MRTELGNLLDRFHRTLVDEIRRTKPEYLHRPFMIAEIYQALIPYRTHRDTLGVEMNGDYENALLRLLAGEGGYLLVDSDAARTQMAAELEMRDPNVGLFRDFAAVEVRLNPAFVAVDEPVVEELAGDGTGDEASLPPGAGDSQAELALDERARESGSAGETSVGSPTPPPSGPAPMEAEPSASTPRQDSPANGTGSSAGVESAVAGSGGTDGAEVGGRAPSPEHGREVLSVTRLAPDAGSGDATSSARAAPSGPFLAAPAPSEPGEGSQSSVVGRTSGACPRCHEDLPVRPGLEFCPFCGSPQTVAACVSCGAALEPGWGFCIRCGVKRSG